MQGRISALGTQSWACLRGELHLDALGSVLEWPGSQMTTCAGCPGAVWLLPGAAHDLLHWGLLKHSLHRSPSRGFGQGAPGGSVALVVCMLVSRPEPQPLSCEASCTSWPQVKINPSPPLGF